MNTRNAQQSRSYWAKEWRNQHEQTKLARKESQSWTDAYNDLYREHQRLKHYSELKTSLLLTLALLGWGCAVVFLVISMLG
jgi:hypothetical protein